MQEGVDVETIVVLNNCTDDSPFVARNHLHMVDVLEAPASVSNGNMARNLGLAEATGDWVQFLDADDYLEPGKIASNLRLVQDGIDAVYSPVIEESGSERHVTEYFADEDDPLRWIRWKLCQTGGLLWRREALDKIGGWDESMPHCQDNELCGRALRSGLEFAFDLNPGAVYRIHGEDTVSRKDPNAVSRTKTRLQVEMLEWLEKSGTATDTHRMAVGQALLENIRMIARTDIDAADALRREYSDRVEPVLAGPAAPRAYRLAYRTLGFRAAEQLARKRR